MSSKRRLRRHECGRKQPLSQGAAKREAARLSKVSGTRVSAYACPWSGRNGRAKHWHVGHTPRRIKQAMAAKAAGAR